MTRKMNHIEMQPELTPEILHVISGTRIAWNRTKEEIWPELLAKMEDKKATTSHGKTVYLKVIRYAAAAVFALFVGVSSAMYFYTKTIKTSLGQQTVVLLPDNSGVTVYAQSNLTYKPWLWMFARTVKLEGEGLFEVQKGKKFEVVSPKGKTMVLGTQFTVYARNNAYNVTCFTGKVKVVEMSKQNEAIITGGQKATLKSDGYFEVTDTKYVQPESNKMQENQVIDEALRSVLSIPGEKVQAKEETKTSTEKQIIAQPRTGTTDNTAMQKEATEPSAKPTQPEVVLPNKDQAQPTAQTQAQPKEQQRIGEEKATEQPAANQQGKDKFRASLTPEQISILENQQMGKDEKRKAFMQSLSPEQRQLLDEQNRERSRQAESAKPEPGKNEEIKEQQKMQTQQQMQNNTQNREQQKQQTQQGQGKPGTSGSGSAGKPETGKRN